MRKVMFSFFVISLACFLPVAAGDVYHHRGNIAVAWFETEGAVISIGVSENQDQVPPGKGATSASLTFWGYRYGEEPVFQVFTVKSLLPDEFQVHPALQWARLATQVEVVDDISGDALTFNIDLTIKATRPAQRYKYHEHIFGPDAKLDYWGTELRRSAEAVGTVFLGTENLTPIPSLTDWTYLMNVKLTQVSVTKQLKNVVTIR